MDLDDPQTTIERRRTLSEKGFLRMIYQEWYSSLSEWLSDENTPVLEVGSGAGFMRDFVPHLIASDVIRIPGIAVILDAGKLSFPDESLGAIVMTNVLHHLPRPRTFFEEVSRCLKAGGLLAMIEPWVTRWSQLVYTRLHHEPFTPDSPRWEFESIGPLSGANGALPWIIFERDRQIFELEFPDLELLDVGLTMPFRYIVSGGFSRFAPMPPWLFAPWKYMEGLLKRRLGHLAMFAQITVRKRT